MIVVGFYTYSYRPYARTLRKDLDRLGMRHEIIPVADRGGHNANVHQKPEVIERAIHKHGVPVLYVDVDARVHAPLELFRGRQPYDVGAHFWKVEGGPNPERLLGGTLYFGATTYAIRCLRDWRRANERSPFALDQHNLQCAVAGFSGYRVKRLPASYCWIEKAMRPFLRHETPVIEHLAVSRAEASP